MWYVYFLRLKNDDVYVGSTNVHAEIDEATAPTLPKDKRYTHDIRLDWEASPGG